MYSDTVYILSVNVTYFTYELCPLLSTDLNSRYFGQSIALIGLQYYINNKNKILALDKFLTLQDVSSVFFQRVAHMERLH